MNMSVQDMFASVIHDVKNRLFNIEMQLGETPIDVVGLKKSVIESSLRLDQMLTAYRLSRHDSHADLLTMTNVNVSDLVEDAYDQCAPWDARISVEFCFLYDMDWICSKDLVRDIIVNGLQNASRFAKSLVRVSVNKEGSWLVIRIEDDGPGFDLAKSDNQSTIYGVGLYVGNRIMQLHQRHQHCGKMILGKSDLGGAKLELVFPE